MSNQVSKLDMIQARITNIPEDWILCRLSDALVIRNSFRKPISQEVRSTMKGTYPYYGPTKIQDYISSYEQDGEYALIGEDGDHFLKFDVMSQTQFVTGKCTVNNHAHIIESSDICDSRWFYNFFKHRDIVNFLSRQGAGRFKLNKSTLEKLPILVPPLPEQRKIAEILSTWDKAIVTTEKLIAASQQQKKALMQELLTGKKRFAGFSEEWEEVKLKQLGEVVSGGTPSTTNSDYWDGDVFWVTPTDITKLKSHYIGSSIRKISKSGLLNCSAKLVPKGSLLVCTRATIGTLAITKMEMCTNQGFKNLVPNKSTDVEFLYYLLVHERHQLISKASGSTFLELSKKDFDNIRLKVPSFKEQQKIAAVLTAADQEIDALQSKLAHLQQEKKALMQQLLTGKRRVVLEADTSH